MTADVCIILEGAYPYVAGGVSSWTHDLIRAQRDLSFHVVTLLADPSPRSLRFELPSNVVGLTAIPLQQTERKMPRHHTAAPLIAAIEQPLTALFNRGGLTDFVEVLNAIQASGKAASRTVVTNSEPTFAMLQRMYQQSVPGSSFLNYFWSWRSLAGGLFSVLLHELPHARIYHAISTGYAGLVMARAVLETGRPGLLTELGIYTNERRVEIAMAD